MDYLDTLDDEQYECLAKKIADSLAEHDTAGNDFHKHQRHHSGELFYRMCMGSQGRAYKLLDNCTKRYKNNWNELVQDKGFADYVLAFLCGDGMEVEWRAE